MQSLEELTKSLVQNLSGDSLKVLAIYDWVTSNISYDYKALMSGEPFRIQDAQTVYQKRLTTCTGYSNIMLFMLEKAGIPAFEVEGYTRDLTLGLDTLLLNADHSWVAFKMNGQWKVCDATWDAGEIGFLVIKKEEEKGFKKFMSKIKKWKFWRLFWSRERKEKEAKKNEQEGTSKREKITYKVGFLRKPERNYIFTDPSKFIKTHLSSLAHWQMKTAPYNISDFCDSIHLLTDSIRHREGNFDYNSLNDAYFAETLNDKSLWKADSVLLFNKVNYGDRAIHLNFYLYYALKSKSYSKEQLELLGARTDTLIQSSIQAQKTLRTYNINKKKTLSTAFYKERSTDKKIQKSLTMLQTFMQRTPTIYAKGKQKTLMNDDRALALIYKHADQDFELKAKATYDSIYCLNQQKKLRELEDTMRYLCERESRQPDSLISRLVVQLDSTAHYFYNGLVTAHSTTFINEDALLKNDQMLERKFLLLNKMVNDSINKLFSPQRSFKILQEFDAELSSLKAHTNKRRTPAMEDSLKIYSKLLKDLIELEQQTLAHRVSDADEIERAFKESFAPFLRYIKWDATQLSIMKLNRQKYLYAYLNMKTKRAGKVYANAAKNGKTYKAVIKEWKKNVK